MRAVRVLLVAAGCGLAGVGVWQAVVDVPGRGLLSLAVWLGGSIALHDGVLAPTVVLLSVLANRFVPGWARTPLVAGFLIAGVLALLAVPVLGRRGAVSGNPTLLDRNYVAGWLVAEVVLAVVVGCWLAASYRRQRRRAAH